MRKTLLLTLVFAVLALLAWFSFQGKSKPIKQNVIERKVSCIKTIPIDNANLCLSKIDGMVECSTNSFVQEYLKSSSTNSNMALLGFYVPNESYKEPIEANGIPFSETFTLFTLQNFKYDNRPLNIKTLSLVDSSLRGQYQVLKIDSIMQSGAKNQMSMGVPVFVESYIIENNASTSIMIKKIRSTSGETIRVSAQNVVNIKNKFVIATYNLDYINQKSIATAKKKNDFLIMRLLNDNQ